MKTIPKHTLDFIDSWLKLTTKWERTTGLAVAIRHEGKTIFDKTYGYASVEQKVPLTTNYSYRVASQSKTFTSVAILQLQEQGSLRLDDVAVSHLPWLAEHSDKRWQGVTIRQLLNHGAGISRDGERGGFWSLQGKFPDEKNFKEEILRSDLILEPNTQFKYSNFGYGLLGLIIEAVSKQSYTEYVHQHIIKPIGLKSTATDFAENLPLATGYSRENLDRRRFAIPHIPTGALQAATGFCSKPSELCVFYEALQLGTGKLLSDTSKREMKHKQWDVNKEDDSYGLGLDLAERDGRKVQGHSGGFPGFGSRTWCDSENNLLVSVAITEHDTWVGPIVNSIFGIIREFGDKAPAKKLLKYEGRFSGIYSVTDIVAHADGLRQVWPKGWWPMGTVDKLRIIDDTTLQIYDTSGFEDEGEKIIYQFSKDGAPESITIAGDLQRASQDGDLEPWW